MSPRLYSLEVVGPIFPNGRRKKATIDHHIAVPPKDTKLLGRPTAVINTMRRNLLNWCNLVLISKKSMLHEVVRI